MEIPEFQRGFVWGPEQVKFLVDSLLRKYPVGSILTWKNDNYMSPRTGTASPSASWLVDGQQRTTALCLLLGRKPYWWSDSVSWENLEKEYDIIANVDPTRSEIEFQLVNPVRENDPNWIHVRNILIKDDDKELTQAAMDIIKSMGKDPSTHLTEFSVVHSKLSSIWNIRNQQMVISDVEHDIEDVVQIFSRLNKAGTKVKEADIYIALISGKHRNWVKNDFLPFSRWLEDEGFDVINTSFTGFEKERGGRKHQREFVGYSAYYSKDDLIHIPYTRLYHQTFPSHGRLPCDCNVCISVPNLEGMPRDYWNFMIARPHYGVTWDGFLTEMSDYINTNQIQKAKQRLIFSELCALEFNS